MFVTSLFHEKFIYMYSFFSGINHGVTITLDHGFTKTDERSRSRSTKGKTVSTFPPLQ